MFRKGWRIRIVDHTRGQRCTREIIRFRPERARGHAKRVDCSTVRDYLRAVLARRSLFNSQLNINQRERPSKQWQHKHVGSLGDFLCRKSVPLQISPHDQRHTALSHRVFYWAAQFDCDCERWQSNWALCSAIDRNIRRYTYFKRL